MIGKAGQVYQIGPFTFQFVQVFFTTANASYPVPHKLDTADVGVMVVDIDKPARIYSGPIPRSRSSVNRVSDTAGVNVTFLLVAPNVTKR